MNLANKTFKDNRTGQVVKVIDSFENIAILEDRTKIDTRRLLDASLYTEQIDPSSFFGNSGAYNSIFEKIKTIPTEGIPDDVGEIKPVVRMDETYRPASEDTAVVYTTVDDEKEELARKYGVSRQNWDTGGSVARQNEAFSKILGEEVEEMPAVQVPRPTQAAAQQAPEVRVEESRVAVAEDPIVGMFKGVKRPVEFAIDFSVDGRIPRLDFIEMMEDSYERSIIDFLADEFTKQLLSDPNAIKQKIAARIKDMVWGKKPSAKRSPKAIAAQGEKPGYKKPVRKKAVKKPVLVQPKADSVEKQSQAKKTNKQVEQ